MATLFEKLNFKNIGIERVQSVDEMTVIPIVGPDQENVVADPSELKFVRTSTYGTMQFDNSGEKPAIVPANFMIRGKDAQDHAMSGVGIVIEKSKSSFNTACCIEETQGGYLRSEGNEEDVLPIQLRKNLLNPSMRKQTEYGKLWDDIRTWLRGVVNRSSAHLRHFYDKDEVRSALEEFAAEFEPVDKQIGAIILFSGVPVGLEIMPTSEHWNAYWKQLLRGCYGAELIRLKMLGKIKPSTLLLPDIPTDAKPEKVQEIIESFMEQIRQEIIPVIKDTPVRSLNETAKYKDLASFLLQTDNGGGDIILQDTIPIYVSIVL